MIIDAHQHYWTLERGDYRWLTPELQTIYRDFQPGDLQPLMAETGVEGTILVQATDTEAETTYLLSLADAHDSILGVVGWVDMESAEAPERIARFAEHRKFVGIRPMIQNLDDDEWMLQPTLAPAIDALVRLDLTFDALVMPRHLLPLKTFLARYPDVKVIIDHGAKPEIRNSAFQPWADHMADIAESSTVYCKLSGLVTEASTDWKPEDIEPYIEHIFATFGPKRTVFGSDWPVLNLAGDYASWITLARQCIPEDAAADVFGGNAETFYLRQI